VRVLAVSGSLRRASYNRALLRAAARALPSAVEVVELEGIGALPAYDEDLDRGRALAPVAELRERIAAADALLFATPEYSGSVPGALKNALDWASRPWPDCSLRGKPALVVGASTGLFGAVWAQAELRKVLSTAGADVLASELPVGVAHVAFDADGRLADPALRAMLDAAVAQLLERCGWPVGAGA
jgi:chromate reductase, NAD(P)H dehydrogenase (quinone)